MSTADGSHIPDLLLERYALGELSADAAREVARRLTTDAGAQARLEELRRSNAAILASYPPEVAAARIAQRLRLRENAPAKKHAFTWLMPVGSAVFACALAFLILKPTQLPQNPESPETTRVKGLMPRLLIFAKPAVGEQPHALINGAAVRAHDLVQIGYIAAGKPHGVVLSIDGRGAATLHFPASIEQSTHLGAGQVLLPSAYELDDAPHFERFFLLTSAAPIDVAAALAAARKLAADSVLARTAPLAISGHIDQIGLLLVKEASKEPNKDYERSSP